MLFKTYPLRTASFLFLLAMNFAVSRSAFAQYCSVSFTTYSTCVGGNITNVTFAGINNTVACLSGGGYRDYTGTVAAGRVSKGQSYPVSLTVHGGSWYGGSAIWIDFDKNGVFDAGEKVFTQAYAANVSLHSGTISIPSTARPGITTMRVVATESSTPATACGAQTYGEAQDYKIIISGGGDNNVGISTVDPSNLGFCMGNQDVKVRVNNSGSNTVNYFTIEWTVDGVPQSPVFWSASVLDTVGGAGASDTLITLGSVSFANAPRNIRAWTSLPNGITDTVNTDDTIMVSLQAKLNCASLPTYCTPTFSSWSSCIGGAVAAVNFAGMSSTTPCLVGGGYRDLTNTVTAPVVMPGQTYPISITIGSSYPTGGGGIVWMDLDRNGTFDPSEAVFTGTYNSSNTTPHAYNGTITIPSSMQSGYVLMRVMGRESGTPSTSCGASGYGEANDYLIYVGSSAPNNASVKQVLPLTQTFCAGTQDIKARIKNTGSNVLSNVTVDWTIDGVPQAPLFWSFPLDTLGGVGPNDTLVTLGQASFTAGVISNIRVWTSLPNFVQDTMNTDDTLTVGIEPSVVGPCASYTLPTYCTPSFINYTSSCVGGNVSNVTFAGINKNTTCTAGGNYYMNYTTSVSPAKVSPGKSYPISITVGGASYAGGGAAWIDYNHNGVFESSEQVFIGTYTGSTPQTYTGNVQIPLTALPGYTVMRVMGTEVNTPPATAACTNGAYYGEAQDYVIVIGERASNNAAVTKLVAPVAFCPGSYDVSVRVANHGKNAINNLTIEWTLNGTAQAPVYWYNTIDTIGSPTAVSDTAIVIGNVSFAAGSTQNIRAWTSLPNSMQDTSNTDDTLTVSIKPALSGNYTIGSGGNYTSFAAVAADLSNAGICGPVTFNVTAGATFNESPLAFINVGNGTDSVIFRRAGTGNNPIVSCTGTAGSDDAAIDLRGAKLVTFDGIDIRVVSTAVEYGYRLTNTAGRGSSNNTIRNSRIIMSRSNTLSIGLVQTSNSVMGGGFDGTSFNLSNHNNTYKNIRVENAYNGIVLFGAYAYPDTNCVVTSEGADTTTIGANTANDIGNSSTAVYGIYFNSTRNSEISKCIVRNLTHTSTSLVQGILVDNSGSGSYGTVNVYNNYIYNINRTSTSTSTSSYTSGIRLELSASATAYVFNNVLYNITSTGNTSSANAGLAIRGISYGASSGTGTAYFYNNTVQISNASLNRSSTAFWRGGSGTVVLRNNIFSNITAAQSGVAKHYVIYRNAGTFNSSGNLFWTLNTNGFTGYYGTDLASIQNWRSTSAQDQHSLFYRPAFRSATDLRPDPADSAAWAINGRAQHMGPVSMDITGAARPAGVAQGTPDLGAFEFTPTSVAPLATAVPATASAGGTQVFLFAEDTVARISWDITTVVPAGVYVRFYPGATAPQLSLSGNEVLNCYWRIDLPAGSYNYFTTLNYQDIWRGSIQSVPDLRVAKQSGTGSWLPDYASTADLAGGFLVSGNIFDPSVKLTGANQFDPLPVKLLGFSAEKQGRDVLLQWGTASETNSAGFFAERSADGKTWRTAGFVPATGNSSRINRYSLTDLAPFSYGSSLLYRLKMTDNDGTVSYSNIVSVRNESGPGEHSTEVYPNPFSDELNVAITTKTAGSATISITDLTGKLISSEARSLSSGVNVLNITQKELVSGVYFLSVQTENQVFVKKIIKQ